MQNYLLQVRQRDGSGKSVVITFNSFFDAYWPLSLAQILTSSKLSLPSYYLELRKCPLTKISKELISLNDDNFNLI